MRNVPQITAVVSLLSLALSPCVLGQPARPARPAGGRPPAPGAGAAGPGVGAPGVGAPGAGIGAPGMAQGAQELKPRALEDKPLEEKEQKKYDAMISSMEKRSAGTRSGQAASRSTELAAAFKLASTQLRYGQEKTAKDTLDKAWQMVPELYREAKSAMAATGQIRTHLREIQMIAGKDPQLALALMIGMDEAHKKALEAIEQEKSKGQLAQPLAQTWFQIMQIGPLDKEGMDKASYWIMLFPQMALVDRPLSPQAENDYQSQLTSVTVNITPKLRQLAEKQLAQSGRPARPFNPNEAADTVDPVTAQMISSLEAKSTPLSEFMKAEIHFNFGQFREGMAATMGGWRELLEYYRQNAGNVSPADTELHFSALERVAAGNPIQTMVVVDQLDLAYRNMLKVDRFFGVRVADLWAKLATGLPLAPPMLVKAAFWLDYVGKQHKDMDTKYAATLADIKDKLKQAGIGKDDDDGKKDDDKGKEDDDKNEKGEPEKKGVSGRRGLSIPRTIDTLKRAEKK